MRHLVFDIAGACLSTGMRTMLSVDHAMCPRSICLGVVPTGVLARLAVCKTTLNPLGPDNQLLLTPIQALRHLRAGKKGTCRDHRKVGQSPALCAKCHPVLHSSVFLMFVVVPNGLAQL